MLRSWSRSSSGRDDQRVDHLQRDPAGLYRGGTGNLQRPQRFHHPIVRPRGDRAATCVGGVGGLFSVDGVVLAAFAAVGLVASRDFEDLDPGLVEVAHNPGPVGAGALDADPGDVAVGAHPPQHCPVPGAGGGECLGRDDPVVGIDDRGYVQVLVGVDAADHDRRRGCVRHGVLVLPAR